MGCIQTQCYFTQGILTSVALSTAWEVGEFGDQSLVNTEKKCIYMYLLICCGTCRNEWSPKSHKAIYSVIKL